MKRIFPFLLTTFLIISCGTKQSPSDIFDVHFEKEQMGSLSFDEFLKAFSVRKQQDINSSLSDSFEKYPDKKERVKEGVLKGMKTVANCKKMELQSEKIEKNNAIVKYSVHNICDGDDFFNTEIIYMVYENGWKIDEIDIKL